MCGLGSMPCVPSSLCVLTKGNTSVTLGVPGIPICHLLRFNISEPPGISVTHDDVWSPGDVTLKLSGTDSTWDVALGRSQAE